MIHGPKETQRRAGKLRQAMTLPEVLLWQELRKRPGDLKFRRQHPAGPFVLDFFCAQLALAIEVDGMAHDCQDVSRKDEVRDEWLRAHGITVLRFTAKDVLNDTISVVEAILANSGDLSRSSP